MQQRGAADILLLQRADGIGAGRVPHPRPVGTAWVSAPCLVNNQSLFFILSFCLPVAIVLYFIAGRLSMRLLSTGLHRI